MFNQSPTDPPESNTAAASPLNGLKKFSVKFHGEKPATNDPTTGQSTPASGPTHGIAEIALESHPPEKQGLTAAPAKPQTTLSPLEETLFKHWATANGIDESMHGDPNNHYDFRGMYRQSNGLVHPPGHMLNAATQFNRTQDNQPEPIRQLLDMIKPAQSHPPQLTMPGMPSFQQTIQGKLGILGSMGDTSPATPMLQSALTNSVR